MYALRSLGRRSSAGVICHQSTSEGRNGRKEGGAEEDKKRVKNGRFGTYLEVVSRSPRMDLAD